MQCNEIRNYFADYLAEDLDQSTLEEFSSHLKDCPACHDELEALTDLWVKLGSVPAGEPASPDLDVRLRASAEVYEAEVQAAGKGRRVWMRLPAFVAIAAAIAIAVLVPIRMFQRAPAILEDVAGSRKIEFGEVVRSGDTAGRTLVLADGSRVEMRTKSELLLEPAHDGVRIRLRKGSVLVTAAKQHNGHLYVQTKDVTVSVIGTVFLVNAEEEGSRVAVIEGEVRVQQGATETKLKPGEQVNTNPRMESQAVRQQIAWSSRAPEHIALLQQSAPPAAEVAEKFEEASIRLSPPPAQGTRGGGGGGGGGKPNRQPCFVPLRTEVDPSRLTLTRATLHGLIAAAYGATCTLAGAIAGEPEWATSEQYDIQALIPPGSPVYTRTDLLQGNAPKLQKMLQNLLADRFKLTLRREMKEMPAYDLVVVKPGKWECHLPAMCHGFRFSEDQSPDANPVDREGMTANQTTLNLHTSISGWTGVVALNTGRPTIDKTGLKGFYDIRLEYPGPIAPTSVEDVNRLGAVRKEQFSATIQEQLGFKLVDTKTTVEVLTIEHVERPSEN